MPSTYTPIATTTLGSSASSYTFTSISGSYTDLILISQFSLSGSSLDVQMRVGNGSIDSGSNYSYTLLYGNGTTAGSFRGANKTELSNYYIAGANTSQSVMIHQFQNYSNTTTNKTILGRPNTAGTELQANVGLWRSTSAINQISIFPNAGTFQIGSTFTLYGIQAA